MSFGGQHTFAWLRECHEKEGLPSFALGDPYRQIRFISVHFFSDVFFSVVVFRVFFPSFILSFLSFFGGGVFFAPVLLSQLHPLEDNKDLLGFESAKYFDLSYMRFPLFFSSFFPPCFVFSAFVVRRTNTKIIGL